MPSKRERNEARRLNEEMIGWRHARFADVGADEPGMPNPDPLPIPSSDQGVWLCAKCGRGSEAHALDGPSDDCVADMRLVPPTSSDHEPCQGCAELRSLLDAAEKEIARLREALNYIAGYDVAGYEPHMLADEVAQSVLSSEPRSDSAEGGQG